MYNCDTCGRGVKAVAGDAIHFVSNKKLCEGCLHDAAHRASSTTSAARSEDVAAARSERGRKAWTELPEETRKERLAALAKGRAARRLSRGEPAEQAVGT